VWALRSYSSAAGERDPSLGPLSRTRFIIQLTQIVSIVEAKAWGRKPSDVNEIDAAVRVSGFVKFKPAP
jgi:hypothetical protein